MQSSLVKSNLIKFSLFITYSCYVGRNRGNVLRYIGFHRIWWKTEVSDQVLLSNMLKPAKSNEKYGENCVSKNLTLEFQTPIFTVSMNYDNY